MFKSCFKMEFYSWPLGGLCTSSRLQGARISEKDPGRGGNGLSWSREYICTPINGQLTLSWIHSLLKRIMIITVAKCSQNVQSSPIFGGRWTIWILLVFQNSYWPMQVKHGRKMNFVWPQNIQSQTSILFMLMMQETIGTLDKHHSKITQCKKPSFRHWNRYGIRGSNICRRDRGLIETMWNSKTSWFKIFSSPESLLIYNWIVIFPQNKKNHYL